MSDRARQRLELALAENADQIARLEADHASLVAATESSNTDDEHDPEGATIAYEREQLSALLARLREVRAELEAGLLSLEAGSYGTCARCGGPIAPERLEARPQARLCIDCARAVG
jgi:RNA polymerase-binding transcription factor DksA